MTILRRFDRFLLSSTFGKTLRRLINFVLLVVCGTWYGVKRSELERGTQPRFRESTRDLILTTRNESVAAAERAEQAAVGALRSSLCGLEAQAAVAGVAAATTARAYLALLEQEELTSTLQ